MEARLAKSVGLNFDGFALDNFFLVEREREIAMNISIVLCSQM